MTNDNQLYLEINTRRKWKKNEAKQSKSKKKYAKKRKKEKKNMQ